MLYQLWLVWSASMYICVCVRCVRCVRTSLVNKCANIAHTHGDISSIRIYFSHSPMPDNKRLCRWIAKCKKTMCLPIYTLIKQRLLRYDRKEWLSIQLSVTLFFYYSSPCFVSIFLGFFSHRYFGVRGLCLVAQPVDTQIEGKIEIMFVHNYRECENATMALGAQMVWTKIVYTKPPIVDLSAHQIPSHNFQMDDGIKRVNKLFFFVQNWNMVNMWHSLPKIWLRMHRNLLNKQRKLWNIHHKNGVSAKMNFELISPNDVKLHR